MMPDQDEQILLSQEKIIPGAPTAAVLFIGLSTTEIMSPVLNSLPQTI